MRPHSSGGRAFLGKEEVTGSSPVVGSALLVDNRMVRVERPKEKHAVWDVTTELAWWGLKAR